MKIVSIITLLIIISQNLAGQISYNQEFQVNPNSHKHSNTLSVTSLIQGGFVVCWSAYDDEENTGIFGQIFLSDGNKQGSEFQVSPYSEVYQRNTKISSLTDGGFVVCWEKFFDHANLGNIDIFGQIYDSDGKRRGSEFLVNTYTSDGWRMNHSVSSLSNGKFFVCWTSHGQVGDNSSIFGQLFENDGTKLGSEFQISSSTINSHRYPTVSTLSDGGFVICWESYNPANKRFDILGQIFESDGTKRGSEFLVNTIPTINRLYSNVSNLLDGGFIVCWSNDDEANNRSDILGQIFESDGTKRGTEFLVSTITNSKQKNPIVIASTDGGFIVCWFRDANIFCKIYESDGTVRGPEFKVNSSPKADKFELGVSALTNDRFIVCWRSGPEYKILGKFYNNYPIFHSLQPFSLHEPKNDKTLENTSSVFTWGKASSIHINFSWELEYVIYIDDFNEFSNPRIIPKIYDNDTSYIVQNLTPGTSYFWKVLAKNIYGDSLWSTETNHFFVSEEDTSKDVTASEIQDMIDAAQPGDIIMIPEGDYPGNIFINKPVTLIAEDDSKVNIRSSNLFSPTVYIEADNVNLENLSIFGANVNKDNLDGKNALFINNSSSVSLKNCFIQGGQGRVTDTSRTSVAGTALIVNSSGNIRINNCVIWGGQGRLRAVGDNKYETVTDGGTGATISNSTKIIIQETTIVGGEGSFSYYGESKGGTGIYINSSSRIVFLQDTIKGGEPGENHYSTQIHEIIGEGRPALRLVSSDFITIDKSCFKGSSQGEGGAHGIYSQRVEKEFLIVESILDAGGNSGHGFYTRGTIAEIRKSKIYGTRGMGRTSIPGDGIHALLNSAISIDYLSTVVGPLYALDFYTDDTSIITFINSVPSTFSLLSPANGDTLKKLPAIFSWSTSIDPAPQSSIEYLFSIFESDRRIFETTTTDTFYVFEDDSPIRNDCIYTWNVKATDGIDTVAHSSALDFKVVFNGINFLPSPVNLLTPQNTDTLSTSSVYFKWSKSKDKNPEDILSYTIMIRKNENVIFDSTLTDTVLFLDNFSIFKNNNIYNWLVSVSDGVDTSSIVSDVSYFFVSLTDEFEFLRWFHLYQNFPNPFNQKTTIKYILPLSETTFDLNIRIYNILGQLVYRMDKANQKSGIYNFIWNGVNNSGDALPSGVYYLIVQTDRFKAKKKMVLIR